MEFDKKGFNILHECFRNLESKAQFRSDRGSRSHLGWDHMQLRSWVFSLLLGFSSDQTGRLLYMV